MCFEVLRPNRTFVRSKKGFARVTFDGYKKTWKVFPGHTVFKNVYPAVNFRS